MSNSPEAEPRAKQEKFSVRSIEPSLLQTFLEDWRAETENDVLRLSRGFESGDSFSLEVESRADSWEIVTHGRQNDEKRGELVSRVFEVGVSQGGKVAFYNKDSDVPILQIESAKDSVRETITLASIGIPTEVEFK